MSDFWVLLPDGQIVAYEVKGSFKIFMDDAKVKCKIFADKFHFPLYAVAPRPKRQGGGWECLPFCDAPSPLNLDLEF